VNKEKVVAKLKIDLSIVKDCHEQGCQTREST